jgi:hypothetical protein
VQDGARLHYALPAALQRAGALERVYVDWFVRSGSLEEKVAQIVQRFVPDLGQRLLERRCDELSADRVVASPWLALRMRLILQGSDAPERRFARISRTVARHVRRRGWGNANAVMGFVRNIDPELCETAHQAGFTVVVDQMIAPAVIQRAEEQRQESRWPSWPPTSEFVDGDVVCAMEARTWAATHHITCPSDYVRDGLLQAHVPADKISVIPYPIDAQGYPFVDRRHRVGPPIIGFVGSVALRKGAPAFIEVARRFDPKQARFVMVGPIAADMAQKARQASSVELAGAVPRGQVRHWLERFDVFFFPSTCEGSAGAIMEAMATGLPVVTTPNSGSVVRNGIEGFIVPCDDLDAFEGCLSELIGDPACRVHMGRAARRRASSFNLDWYSRQLRALFDRLLETRAVTGNQELE